MKYIYAIILASVFTACSTSNEKQSDEKTNEMDHSAHMTESKGQPKSKSPKTMAMSNVGDNHIHIEYHAPSKRGRQIFGGLVAYNEVWVTGAHSATFIQFSDDVEIGGTEITAGKYALFTIPGEDEWTIIINKNWDQHLADDYDAAEDLVRVQVIPQYLDETVETLTYEIKALNEQEAQISIAWDNVKVNLDIKNI